MCGALFYDQVIFLKNLPNTLNFLQVKIYHDSLIHSDIFSNLPMSLKKFILVLDETDGRISDDTFTSESILMKYGTNIKIPFDCQFIVKYCNPDNFFI